MVSHDGDTTFIVSAPSRVFSLDDMTISTSTMGAPRKLSLQSGVAAGRSRFLHQLFTAAEVFTSTQCKLFGLEGRHLLVQEHRQW